MEWIKYSGVALFLLVTELLYFRLAGRWNIIDRPNERSSHSEPTIRGAGIIFPVAILLSFAFNQAWPLFVAATMGIAIVSFADDLKPVSSGLRALVQVVAMLLLFYQLSLFEWPIALRVIAFIVSVGALNAFNFMDGINGITGLYALTNIATLIVMNKYIVPFTDESLLYILSVALVIFLFFNLRKKARGFAGDVGSITLAFVQVFLMFQLIETTHSLMWVGLFLVFGADSVMTIIYRLRKRENIFKPHRQHVFQYLSNELKLPHSIVSFAFAIVQGMINATLIFLYVKGRNEYVSVLIGSYLLAFVIFRSYLLLRIKRAQGV